MQNHKAGKNSFVLKEYWKETSVVSILRFAPEHGHMFDFIPGQYVTLYFPNEQFGWQGKSYSIVSIPGEDTFSIAVKKMGAFSNTLHALNPGERILVEGPAGHFYHGTDKNGSTKKQPGLIFLAAGIGIAPFFSILKNLDRSGDLARRKVFLFYSNKTFADIAFFHELKTLAKKYPNLKITYTLTREKRQNPAIRQYGRFSPALVRKYPRPPNDYHYFICGSISFVNDFWKGLKENGIAEERIFTEAFY